MDRIIKQVTERLVSLLPDDHQYYRLDELRSWGFPVFIVQRIRVELERNLAESMILPETDWADLQSQTVRTIWDQFVNAIREAAHLPASYAHAVIETAVADVIEMLVQPQKNLPGIIFGKDGELTYDQLVQQMDAVVVYRHFSTLIPRYMQKKEVEKLSRERCAQIIANVDERLTARYSPLNWAQMLEPLFHLMDEQIDADLLRLFFEDKKMPRMARQFDELNTAVTRAQLIEVLSSPDSLNFEGYENEDSKLSEPENAGNAASGKPDKSAKAKGQRSVPKEHDPESESENEQGDSEADVDLPENKPGTVEKDAEKKEPDDEEFTINKVLFGKDMSRGGEEKERALNDVFMESEAEDGDGKSKKAPEGNESEPVGEKLVAEPQEPENIFSDPKAGKETPTANKTDTEGIAQKRAGAGGSEKQIEEDETETPMWKRFMSPEDIAKLEEEEVDVDEDGFIDEPVIDLTTNSEISDLKVSSLKKLLKDERKFFVKAIFGGSDRAYDEILENIAAKDDWRSASKYIEKEVFKRNLVDIYSEAAVDFTDRLQTYFSKHHNQ